MDSNSYVVIMAGGVGSRFWPYSRQKFPKQFHDVLGVGKSLLQLTVERYKDVCPLEQIFIVTNAYYVELVKEQLPDFSENQILGEPLSKNTAPCIAYAAYKIHQLNPNANLIVCPSDHIILNQIEYTRRLKSALDSTSKNNVLVTLGIKPSRPDTGYGYINFVADQKSDIKKVKTFTEKPSVEIAQMFIESGEYVWNAGIFIWSSTSIIRAFEKYMPELADLFSEGNSKYNTDEEMSFIKRVYEKSPNISIDYAILEKANNVYVVLSDFGWSDLGTWNSLHDVRLKDENNNVLDGDILTFEVKNSIVKTPINQLVVLQGLDGYIVAEHDNVLLVCKKNQEQRVKEFVAEIKKRKNKEDFI